MSLIKFNPPRPLTGQRDLIENCFSEPDNMLKNWDWNFHANVPAVNVKEEDNQYLIEVVAPG